jgi:hypothetical protein
MAIIRFPTNIAQRLRLKSLDYRSVESQFGGIQHMFTAQEGAFYVSDKVGGILMEQFRALGVQPGDLIEITKGEVGRGPERKTQWIVTQPVAAEQPNPAPAPPKVAEPSTELEQTLAASIRMIEARKQAQSAPTAKQPPAWAGYLVEQSNALIDCYSQVMAHASQYPNVRGEDVRSIFLSTFINVSKSGARNVA